MTWSSCTARICPWPSPRLPNAWTSPSEKVLSWKWRLMSIVIGQKIKCQVSCKDVNWQSIWMKHNRCFLLETRSTHHPSRRMDNKVPDCVFEGLVFLGRGVLTQHHKKLVLIVCAIMRNYECQWMCSVMFGWPTLVVSLFSCVLMYCMFVMSLVPNMGHAKAL